MAAYGSTIFIGAFLLFQVQPLIGKYILPWFGGGPGVWTACMLFFQVLLLCGYAYAHFSSRFLKPRTQALLHLVLLGSALAWLPITPRDSWKPQAGGEPTFQILLLLLATLGPPYFVLAATGPLMQQWFSQANPRRSPYRLYALSNIGSLLALISYPFFFEIHFSRKTQAAAWSWGLVVYAAFCAWCTARMWWLAAKLKTGEEGSAVEHHETNIQRLASRNPSSPSTRYPAAAPSSTLTRLLWLLLPACASALLLAITNKMCQDVAVIPFLWVLPLAIYLLSFILCFDSPRWYVRFVFTLGLVAVSAAICWALFQGTDLSIRNQLTIYSAGLFVCCMVCHGELYRLRPEPRRLTAYYLMIAAGGALGGIFVAVLAPLIFTDYFELHWGLLFCSLLFLIICAEHKLQPAVAGPPSSASQGPDAGGSKLHIRRFFRVAARQFSSPNDWRLLACTLPLLAILGLDWFLGQFGHEMGEIHQSKLVVVRVILWTLPALVAVDWFVRKRFKTFLHWRLLACAWLALGVAALAVSLWMQSLKSGGGLVSITRNFYGVLMVFEHELGDPKSHYFLLQHGRITHGIQFVDSVQARWPTSYYGEESGVGLAMKALPPGSHHIGLVGLGTGTLAAYGQTNDYFRIYEINPEVKRLATSRFTYLSNCMAAAKVDVVLGDARLSLEKDPPQHFDLLALDAFSSDAIPVHLLTKEAFALYQYHLKTNGIIAIHISNHYLNLEPVVANLARYFNYRVVAIDYDEADERWWLYSSTWLLLTHDRAVMDFPPIRDASYRVNTNPSKVPLWTDDFASLFQILK